MNDIQLFESTPTSQAKRVRRVRRYFGVIIGLIGALLLSQANSLRAADQPAAHFLLTWGKKGTQPGEFHFPIGIAINRADEVFITDHYNSRIQRFDRNGKLLAHFSVLPNPGGIAFDKDEHLYLGHFPASSLGKAVYPDRISVYETSGRLLREWGRTGAEPGEFNYPGGIAITGAGRVYVADQTNHRMQVFDREGRFLFTWGKYGSKPGEFGGTTNVRSRVGGPDFVAIDKQGNVYTTEAMFGRVQKFTADGKFLSAFGNNEERAGSFGGDFIAAKRKGTIRGPVAICVDHAGHLWISAVSGRVQQFTSDGHYLRGLGEQQGIGPGQFIAPHGVAIDSRGHLYVVDSYNHRIQKFDVGEP